MCRKVITDGKSWWRIDNHWFADLVYKWHRKLPVSSSVTVAACSASDALLTSLVNSTPSVCDAFPDACRLCLLCQISASSSSSLAVSLEFPCTGCLAAVAPPPSLAALLADAEDSVTVAASDEPSSPVTALGATPSSSWKKWIRCHDAKEELHNNTNWENDDDDDYYYYLKLWLRYVKKSVLCLNQPNNFYLK